MKPDDWSKQATKFKHGVEQGEVPKKEAVMKKAHTKIHKCEKCGKTAVISVDGNFLCNTCFTSGSRRLAKAIREYRDGLLNAAMKWSTENGLVPPLTIGDITPVALSKNVTISVTDTKDRSAICTFREDGSRDMFERTDRVTGG